MPAKIYRIELSGVERQDLQELVDGGAALHKRKHAQILLLADEAGEGEAWRDEDIAKIVRSHRTTVERVRKLFVLEGFDAAIERAEQANRKPRKLDGKAEAILVATACGKPPEGRATWTLQLLADELVELEIVDSISCETVRRTLKKRIEAVEQEILLPAEGRQRGICGGDGEHS